MNPRLRFLMLVLLAASAATVSHARLGENLAELKKRFGAPAQQVQPRKDQATWLFEGEGGQLVYSVTFNAKGQSVAEGFKPLKSTIFGRRVALDFIDAQLAPLRDSKSRREVKPGEKYRFAGRDFTCGKEEYVVLDEPRGLLLIWSQVVDPAVMVVSPEIFQRGK